MTGKDLIVYILTNNLENEEIFKEGKFIGFLTDVEVAARLGVGVATVHALVLREILHGVQIGENVYIFGDFQKELRGAYE